MLLEQYPSLLSRSGFPLFRFSTALGRDVFHQESRNVLHILHCGFSLDRFCLNRDPISDLEITTLAVISVSAPVTLPTCNFMTK